MSEQGFIVQIGSDGVAVVTLNRPERLNALSHALLVDLRGQLQELEADTDVRVIVLTGAGRAFSAGADLSAGPSDAEQVVRDYYTPLVLEMMAMRTPLIAAVNGPAAGADFSLTLACDFRIVADSAYFQLSFVRVGLVPDAGATWLLPRTVGRTRATEIALLGGRILPEDALSWSMVNEVVPADQLLKRAHELAAGLAASSASVGAVKELLARAWDRTLPEQLDAEATAQGIAQNHPHYAEARAAFRDKRTPRFWD